MSSKSTICAAAFLALAISGCAPAPLAVYTCRIPPELIDEYRVPEELQGNWQAFTISALANLEAANKQAVFIRGEMEGCR